MTRKPLKRTPFKRKASWKKLEPISKDKARRARRFVPESIRKAVLERAGHICEFVDANGRRCMSPAQRQPHHRMKRSAGGKHTLSNLAACCNFHNLYAERFKTYCVNVGWTILPTRIQ
jgi:hypothetical protein